MINPRIVSLELPMVEAFEGCMSYPWLNRVKVNRPSGGVISFESLDDGERDESFFSGMELRIILHEIDHLDGITLDSRRRHGGILAKYERGGPMTEREREILATLAERGALTK